LLTSFVELAAVMAALANSGCKKQSFVELAAAVIAAALANSQKIKICWLQEAEQINERLFCHLFYRTKLITSL